MRRRRLAFWLADLLTRQFVVRTPDPKHPGWYYYRGPAEAVAIAQLIDTMRREQ